MLLYDLVLLAMIVTALLSGAAYLLWERYQARRTVRDVEDELRSRSKRPDGE